MKASEKEPRGLVLPSDDPFGYLKNNLPDYEQVFKVAYKRTPWGNRDTDQETLYFGTLYIATNEQWLKMWDSGFDLPYIRAFRPEITALLPLDRLNLTPTEWEIESFWQNADANSKQLFVNWFSIPHGVKYPSGIPREVSYLLSGMLQTGEGVSYKPGVKVNEKVIFRIFSNYLHDNNLNFLPLLITPTDIRFFVYQPSYQNLERAVEQFQKALARIDGLIDKLPELWESLYSLVRKSELVSLGDQELIPITTRARMEFGKLLGDYRASLGFLYKELPGSQKCLVLNT